MGSEQRPDDALLRRAREAIATASDAVEEDEVVAHISAQLRESGVATRCAWCRRYRVGDEWVRVQNVQVFADHGKASHGICPDCLEVLRASGRSR